LVAARNERVDDVASDESGAAGDEDPHAPTLAFPPTTHLSTLTERGYGLTRARRFLRMPSASPTRRSPYEATRSVGLLTAERMFYQV
jgi:hypothetical protein